MAGVEFSKIMVGRKNENAWLLGAVVPGGITGIWRRNLYMGMRTSIFFGIFGYVYQYSTNNNLTNSLLPYAHGDNPNIPTAAGLQDCVRFGSRSLLTQVSWLVIKKRP